MRIRWRGLELPSRVICNRETLTDTFGEFHVEPFERGFGHTVGNSLRGILLPSLEGSAITRIKILGGQHEFSSIPGMVDDITDLVLNIKLLVVKNHSESPRTLRIDRDRRGVVTAAAIGPPPRGTPTTWRSASSRSTPASARCTGSSITSRTPASGSGPTTTS